MSKALMKISGISGGSEISGYEGWIALNSVICMNRGAKYQPYANISLWGMVVCPVS